MFNRKYNTRNHVRLNQPATKDIEEHRETATDIKKNIAAFNNHLDDSSSKEIITDKMKTYDPDKEWRELSRKVGQTKNPLKDDNLLSFAAHMAGNQFYNSDEINQLYYPLKQEYLQLDQEPAQKIMQLVSAAVSRALELSLKHMQQFLMLSGQKQWSEKEISVKFAALKTEFLKQNLSLSDGLHLYVDSIKSNRLCHKKRVPEEAAIAARLSQLEQGWAVSLASQLQKQFNFSDEKQERGAVLKTLQDMLDKTLQTVFKKFKFSEKKNSAGKQAALDLLRAYDGPYRNLFTRVRLLLQTCPANGKVDTMLSQKLAGCQNELSEAFLEDLITINVGKKALSVQEDSFFKQYFSCSRDSVEDELTRFFALTLKRQIADALQSFQRPTLGSMFEFVSSNPYQFYANLRLSNRSQKRQISNCKPQFFKCDNSVRSWKLHPATTHAVAELQTLTNENLGRRDLVTGLQNYERIYQDLLAIKQRLAELNMEVTDKMLAGWLRAAFHGEAVRIHCDGLPEAERQSMEDMLEKIAYLMHGCEASRNIGMIVITPMLLDLIMETDTWTFEEALTGNRNGEPQEESARLFPMVPEGAVASARSLESVYHLYVPHAYHYPGNQDFDHSCYKMDKDDLVRYEARVVREWLQLKYGADVAVPVKNAAGWLAEVMAGQREHWFGRCHPERSEEPPRETVQSGGGPSLRS